MLISLFWCLCILSTASMNCEQYCNCRISHSCDEWTPHCFLGYSGCPAWTKVQTNLSDFGASSCPIVQIPMVTGKNHQSIVILPTTWTKIWDGGFSLYLFPTILSYSCLPFYLSKYFRIQGILRLLESSCKALLIHVPEQPILQGRVLWKWRPLNKAQHLEDTHPTTGVFFDWKFLNMWVSQKIISLDSYPPFTGVKNNHPTPSPPEVFFYEQL